MLQQLLLLLGELSRRIDNDRDNMRSARLSTQMRNAMTGKLKIGTTLRTGRHFHTYSTIDSIYLNFCTKSGVNHRDVLFRKNNICFAREFFVSLYAYIDVQITPTSRTNGFTMALQGCGRQGPLPLKARI